MRDRVVYGMFLMLLWVPVTGQQDSLLLLDGEQVHSSRYDRIEGSPYLFGDLVIARLMRVDGSVFDSVWVNYNGETGQFETPVGGKIIALDNNWFLRAELTPPPGSGDASGDPLVFQKGIHPDLRDRFAIVLYAGSDVIVFKDFKVTIDEAEPGIYGKNEQFITSNNYYVKLEGRLYPVKLRRKSVIEVFDAQEVENYIRENKLRFRMEDDLIEVARYFDQLYTR